MRATGFFYSTDNQVFLVTARHNVLPTTVSMTNTDGRTRTVYSTRSVLPEIDIFVRSGDQFEQYRYDIRDVDYRDSENCDTIGIPISFNPKSYGYQVWKREDLVPEIPKPEELDVIGFDGVSFPNGETDYTVNKYCQQIQAPRRLNLENPLPRLRTSQLSLKLIGVDKEDEGRYRGLSGSPVLGDKLAGIHIADGEDPIIERFYQDAQATFYTRSGVLAKLLG